MREYEIKSFKNTLIILLTLVFILITYLPSVHANQRLGIVLMQGNEIAIPLTVRGNTEDIEVLRLPYGTSSKIEKGERGSKVLKLYASPDSKPGQYRLDIINNKTKVKDFIIRLEIIPELTIQTFRLSSVNKFRTPIEYILELNDKKNNRIPIDIKASLLTSESMMYSVDKQHWQREGQINFSKGVAKIFISPDNATNHSYINIKIKNLGYNQIIDLSTVKTSEDDVYLKGIQRDLSISTKSTVQQEHEAVSSTQNNSIRINNSSGELSNVASDELGLANTPWPKYHGNRQNTGQSQALSTTDELRWKYLIDNIDDWIVTDPIISSDGTIYIASGFNYDNKYSQLFAVNPDGTKKWIYHLENSYINNWAPAIGKDDTIYLATEKTGDPWHERSGYLYAIDSNGTLKWRFDSGSSGGDFLTPNIGRDGTIYVCAHLYESGYLYAINKDGALKWRYQINENKIYNICPAISNDGTIYIITSFDNEPYTNFLCAINPDGTTKWKYEISKEYAYIYSSPCIDKNGVIYVACSNSIYAINPNGSLKWKFQTDDTIDNSPAISSDGTVYFGSYHNYDGYFYALNSDGSLKWKYQTQDIVSGSAPAITKDNIIYVGDSYGYLYAFQEDGTLRWKYLTQEWGYLSSPAINDDGTIYIADFGNGSLYALGKKDLTTEEDRLAALGNPSYCALGNDPVNLSSGNFILESTDLKIPSKGLPLEFSRFYNSTDTYAGPLGRGWTHNYNMHLIFNEDQSISVSYADGHIYTFAFDGANYIRPAGCFEMLSVGPDNTYILTFKDQRRYTFNAGGQLVNIKDKNNNPLTLDYTDNLLSSVTDPAGRKLIFTYDQNKQLTSITDPVDRKVYFTYDQSGNLATFKNFNGGITQYTYNSQGVISIVDPRGNIILENEYDSSSRVIKQVDGKGNVTQFAYDPANRKTTMTDAKGNSAVVSYDQKLRVTSILYPENISQAYVYDSNNCLLSETDKNGNTTTYTYDSMGNMLTKKDPDPLNYTTTYTYDPQNNPTQIIDAAGYGTNFTYDPTGNLLSVSREVNGQTATTTFSYNEFGQVVGITDANGKLTTISYDNFGNKVSETNSLGHIVNYTYDNLGRKLTETDPRNHTWTYTYDTIGNLLSVADPLGHVTAQNYDKNNNRISTTDPKGKTITFTYDENNKLATTTNPLGHTTAYGYDVNGNLSSVTDAKGHITSYAYDFLDRLVSTTYPDGSIETLILDGNGNIIAKTDGKGNTTTFIYDALNRLTKIIDPIGRETTTEYDPLGNKIRVTDQRGNSTVFTYDEGSRVLSTTDPLGHSTQYTYDLVGNKLSATNAKGATWSYIYDDANRLIKETDPSGYESHKEYDSVGNIISQTNANGVTTTYNYSAINKLVAVTDALGHRTEYTYDENGNLTGVTNARGYTSTFSYDVLNRLVEETNPLGYTKLLAYDPVGNVVTKTRSDGTSINYSYDVNNRLENITYPDQSGVSYTYDANGNRISMTDPNGITNYRYDSLNRLTSITRSGYSINYAYDMASNISEITYPGDLRVSYSYNELNQPVSVTDAVYSTTITYDQLGNRTQEILPNGVTVNYDYDLNGRLTLLEHAKGQDVIARAIYTHDNLGNRLSLTNERGQTTNFIYDDLNQLTRVQYANGQVVDYAYDKVGNRVGANDVTYTYDEANKLIQMDTVPYGYDSNGNLTSVGESVYYEYDYENRLILFGDGSDFFQYTYDGDGNRIGQTVTGEVYGNHEYIYDINAGLPRLLVEKDGQGNTNNYLYAGRLFSRIGFEGQVFYHHDGLGSISVISDVYGQPLNHYEYDVFGNPLLVEETVSNQFRFTGEPYDPSGLIYLRARYYDPSIGRFLTQDTLFGDINAPLSQNLYAYCGNNPVLYIDPSGHIAICVAPATPFVAAGVAALGTVVVTASGELIDQIDNFFSAKKETSRKIGDIESNPEDWELVDEKPDPKQPRNGRSVRELWRNKNTGELLEKHVLERNGRPANKHPHYKEPEGW